MKAVFSGILIALAVMTPRLACSEPLDAAAINGPTQRYVIMLPEAPVGELAQEVLGETLGLPVTVDERVASRMAFRVDGLYSPKELAREFGYRLWNVDAVLIEDPAEGLMIIPASTLAEAVKDGGEVVSPLALQAPTAKRPAPRTPIVYGARRWDQNGLALTAVGLFGWLAGLASFAGAAWLQRRRRARYQLNPGSLLIAAPGTTPAFSEDVETALAEKNDGALPSS